MFRLGLVLVSVWTQPYGCCSCFYRLNIIETSKHWKNWWCDEFEEWKIKQICDVCFISDCYFAESQLNRFTTNFDNILGLQNRVDTRLLNACIIFQITSFYLVCFTVIMSREWKLTSLHQCGVLWRSDIWYWWWWCWCWWCWCGYISVVYCEGVTFGTDDDDVDDVDVATSVWCIVKEWHSVLMTWFQFRNLHLFTAIL